MGRLKAFALAVLTLGLAVGPGLLINYLLPATSWQAALLRAVLSLVWGFVAGTLFARYVLRKMRGKR